VYTAVPGGEARGTDSTDATRREADPVFANASGASDSVSGESVPPAFSDSDTGDPELLSLGTYRDLWAGPITELNPPLRFLAPQQQVALSLADAERRGLKTGEEVRVSQNGTSVKAKVSIKERVPTGTCFLIEGVADGNANALLNGSPVSVQIEKISAAE